MTDTQLKVEEALGRNAFFEASSLLRNEDRNDAVTLSLLGPTYYILGGFESAYDIYRKLYYDRNLFSDEFDLAQPEKADPTGIVVFRALEESHTRALLTKVPKQPGTSQPQSLEDAEEQFPEYLEYLEFSERIKKAGGGDPAKIRELLASEFTRMLSSDDPAVKARVCYYNAEGNAATKRYLEAADEYLNAAAFESKALYYGYAANMYFKFAIQNSKWGALIPASVFTHRAIRLDPNCAKWYFNEAMTLLMIPRLLIPREGFIASSKSYAEKALSLLRPDQKQLRNTIEKWMENCRKNGVFK